MESVKDIQEGFLSLVQAELSDYGVDPREVFLNSKGQLEILEHRVEMTQFLEMTNWSRPEMSIRAYTTDAGLIVFMPLNEFYDEYRSNDKLYDELHSHSKKVASVVNSLTQEFWEAIRELSDQKTLLERITEGVKANLQMGTSLADIESWQAKVLMANSGGKIGEWDQVGYTHIGLNTGTIVPIARSDEHHQGYDLIHELIGQKLIPDDTYFPIFYNYNYVSGYDPVALQALKTWRKLGGANTIIKNSSRSLDESVPFQLTMDDYIEREGKIEINKGELFPLGQELFEHLKELSSLCQEMRHNERKEKLTYKQALRTLLYYQQKVLGHETTSSKEFLAKIMNAESTGGLAGLQKLEEVFFGFNGLKNQLHQEVRKALDPKSYSFQKENMVAIFGDLELANHLLGSL